LSLPTPRSYPQTIWAQTTFQPVFSLISSKRIRREIIMFKRTDTLFTYTPPICSPRLAPLPHACPAGPDTTRRTVCFFKSPSIFISRFWGSSCVDTVPEAVGLNSSSSSDSYACRGGTVSARGSTFYKVSYFDMS
jgi:hypothetical protein